VDVRHATELAADLVTRTWDRNQAAYVSAGTAVASVKELTLCLRRAWRLRQQPNPTPFGEDLEVRTRLKILLGVALGHELNPMEQRLTIDTPVGEISGRADLLEDADGVIVPGEIKLTWASLDRMGISPQYLEQLASYVLALQDGALVPNGPPSDRAGAPGRLYLFEVVRPRLTCLEITFTADELAAWQAELTARAATVSQEREPSEAHRYGWECHDCPEHSRRGGTCTPRLPPRDEGFFPVAGLGWPPATV
jgi:PD-(D/E)XK nuclease superfamily